MDNQLNTKTRIELLNMWKLLIAIAKNVAGEEIDKEKLKEEIKAQEQMLDIEQKSCVIASLVQLIGDKDDDFDIERILKSENSEK